jgi:hypothetical protein
VAIVASVALGSGCFSEPVTRARRSPVDRRPLGEWDCTSADASSSDRALLTVLRFDDYQYYAEWREGEKVERYRAFWGTLKGVDILNVTDVSDSTSRYWAALRTSFSPDGSMLLALPADRITDLSDDEVRLRTLRREANQPNAWQEFARCVSHQE